MNSLKTITTLFSCLFAATSFAQMKDLSALPAYDCSLKKVITIIGQPTILAAPDHAVGLDAILADYCGTFGNNCIQKKASALTAGDYSKNILMIGVCSDIRNWNKLTTAVTPIKNGFIINGKVFNHKRDGFVFVDTNRIIVSGNSLQAVKDAQLALTGGHDILVVQNGNITFFGNRKDKRSFDWFNLQNLKQTNYNKKNAALFSAIYVSKTFKDSINYPKLYGELQAYVQQFLRIYKLKMPTKKVSWFLHSNMQEYGTMSGMFGLTCPGNSSAGFSIRGAIHTNGFNTGLVKHEYSHFLFDNSIPQDNNPAFFVEGCVEYVTNLNDSNLFKKRIETAKHYKDTLNYSDLIVYNQNFYGQYSAANYAVCGVFVKYIIDRFGVEAFKTYCLTKDKKDGAKNIFTLEFDALVNGYKNWLSTQ
ncbi:MAG: hypothetical protein JST86_12235 [Bacteroidetes bacterium]|nr:hypothetical protein [Bacteroidota bacterium]